MHRLVPLALAVMLGSGCAFVSLNSPRPIDDGETQLGLHAGTLVGLSDDDGGTSGVLFTGTGRFGLGSGVELGFNVGNLGVDGQVKYGFLDHDDPLQVSAIVSAGLYAFSLANASVGALLGYAISDAFMPYVGYRQYLLIAEGVYPTFDVIGGVDIAFTDLVGLLIEVNLAEPISIDVDGGEDETFVILTLTGGLHFTF